MARNGMANVNIDDNILSLNGKHSIVGRAVVVHKTVDDLGKGNNAESKKSGNAGLKIGCGVIGIAAEN
uniref:Superoxide dismutase copper/zinc binding domain-containing protein n=1 Tax=Romanomermis culicivorax TaxID=13658 RepID=A0A915JVN7_ROMCU